MADLFEQYKGEVDVFLPIKHVLLARDEIGDSTSKEFQRQMLADALAIVVDSPYTDEGVLRAIANWRANLYCESTQSTCDGENIRNEFPVYLAEQDDAPTDKQPAPLSDESVF